MKKICWVLILGITMGLVLGSKGYAAWPINRTRPVEGRITDATTGEPIERVIVMGVWRKKEIIGINPGGPRTSKIGYEYSVTDKNGRYRLPGKTSFHIRTGFDSLSLIIIHPLYDSKGIWHFYHKPQRSGEWIFRNERGERLNLVPKKGIIYYNVELMSLEEKWGREIKGEKFRKPFIPGSSYDNNYWILAKKVGISKKTLFSLWEELKITSSKYPYYKRNLEYYKEVDNPKLRWEKSMCEWEQEILRMIERENP